MAQCTRGHANPEGGAFCIVCGEQLVDQPAPEPTAIVPPPPPTGYGQAGYGQAEYGQAGYGQAGYGQGGTADPYQPPGLRRRGVQPWMFVTGVLALLAVVIIGVFVVVRGGLGSSTTTMTVRLAVYTDDFRGCDLGLGYIDVPGSNVIIRADGEIVATGNLGRVGDEDVISCTFTAILPDVPTNADRYFIEIGRRGETSTTRAELEANNWTYSASLGL